jgi:hypothetical protein
MLSLTHVLRYSIASTRSAQRSEIEVIKRNRALAYLKTKQHDATLFDTGFPDFGAEPSDKAMIRAADALYHLTQFEECCRVLKDLCQKFTNTEEGFTAFGRVRR